MRTPRYYGHISGHVIVKVHVNDGPIGLGEASDSKADDLDAVTKRYNDLLVGRDATRITEINEFLRTQNFGSTVSNLHLASAIDLALYDLNGKVPGRTGLPNARRQDARQRLLLLSNLRMAGTGGTLRRPRAICNG